MEWILLSFGMIVRIQVLEFFLLKSCLIQIICLKIEVIGSDIRLSLFHDVYRSLFLFCFSLKYKFLIIWRLIMFSDCDFFLKDQYYLIEY